MLSMRCSEKQFIEIKPITGEASEPQLYKKQNLSVFKPECLVCILESTDNIEIRAAVTARVNSIQRRATNIHLA